MYSWEIQQLMEYKNYLLTCKEYIDMVFGSSQINRVRYNPYSNDYEIWTNDNYYVKFKVYKPEFGENKK